MPLMGRETPRKLELVSLIDVIFLLLIFFLVATTIYPTIYGVKTSEVLEGIETPDSTNVRPSREDAIVIIKATPLRYFLIDDCNASTVIGHGLSRASVRFKALSQRLKGKHDITIRAGRNVPLGQIAKVYDICKMNNPSTHVVFSLLDETHPLRNIERLPSRRMKIYR